MKKIIFSLSVFLILTGLWSFSPSLSFSSADEVRQYYAKVSRDEVYLFSQPNEASEFRVFKIPTSYFVLLTAEANDKFYSCRYSDKTGYVKKDEVAAMNGTPVTPYASLSTTRILAPDGLDMRSTPNKNPLNIVTRVNFLEDNILYYGSLDGDEFIPKNTKTWFYCKYINTTTSESNFGYFYSYYCDKPQIPLNMEEFGVVEGDLFPVTPSKTPTQSTSLSGTAKTLIVIGVSLPCVLILYLLIKPTLISESGERKAKHKKPKRRRGDYFEFDENDLT